MPAGAGLGLPGMTYLKIEGFLYDSARTGLPEISQSMAYRGNVGVSVCVCVSMCVCVNSCEGRGLNLLQRTHVALPR